MSNAANLAMAGTLSCHRGQNAQCGIVFGALTRSGNRQYIKAVEADKADPVVIELCGST
jgi:hypothetical protein